MRMHLFIFTIISDCLYYYLLFQYGYENTSGQFYDNAKLNKNNAVSMVTPRHPFPIEKKVWKEGLPYKGSKRF